MDECVFCKIVKGEIPVQKEHENGDILVFPDVHPQAPVHLLIIPKKHLLDLAEVDDLFWSKVKKVALDIAVKKGLNGFRLVNNVGEVAGVKHFHVHLLGGINVDRNL